MWVLWVQLRPSVFPEATFPQSHPVGLESLSCNTTHHPYLNQAMIPEPEGTKWFPGSQQPPASSLLGGIKLWLPSHTVWFGITNYSCVEKLAQFPEYLLSLPLISVEPNSQGHFYWAFSFSKASLDKKTKYTQYECVHLSPYLDTISDERIWKYTNIVTGNRSMAAWEGGAVCVRVCVCVWVSV